MSKKVKITALTALAALVLLATVSIPQGQVKGKMLYLVTGEFIDPGPMLSPQQLAPLLENSILPSLDALAKLEKEKKVLAGGILVGERAGVMIVEASSNEELDQLIQSLPFWGLLKWKVTPLNSFSARAVQDRQGMERLKKMVK